MAGEPIFKSWAEIFALVVLIMGFLFSIFLSNIYFTYIVICIAGLFAGRYYFLRIGHQPLFPFFLIIIGFLVGYLLGSFAANRYLIIILFFTAWAISHYAHKKGYIPR